MKRTVKFALVAAFALAMTSGTVAASPAQAVAPQGQQLWATVGYMLNGVHVGNAAHYCDGPSYYWGNTTNYDTEHWTYYMMCP